MSGAIPGGGGAPQPYTPPLNADGQSFGPGVAAPAEEGGYRGANPGTAAAFALPKIAALLVYLIAGIASISYMGEFISVTLLLATDFWITKNVAGRILVGLRWWNHVRDDGESEWVFESHPQADKVNSFDKYFFWTLTIGVSAAWWLLVIFSLTSFGKLPLTVLGAILSTANAVGFVKCSRDAKEKVSRFIMKRAMQNPDQVAHVATTTATAATAVASAAHVQSAANATRR